MEEKKKGRRRDHAPHQLRGYSFPHDVDFHMFHCRLLGAVGHPQGGSAPGQGQGECQKTLVVSHTKTQDQLRLALWSWASINLIFIKNA